MTNKLLTLVRAALIAVAMLGSAIVLLASQVQAQQTVTFEGKTYDVSAQQGSYNDNIAAIKASPWWGSQQSAGFAALTYAREVPFSGDFASFAFQERVDGATTYVDYQVATSPSSLDLRSIPVGDSVSPPAFWVTMSESVTSPASVPEINAGALSQVMLMLLALWLVTRGRRETEMLA